MIFLPILVLVLLFAGIVAFGAPFVPTKKRQIEVALELLNLKSGQRLYDLGAGDGRIAIAAAQRGLKVTAYELNPLLVLIALLRTRRYRKLVDIKLANYWQADLSAADGVFIFSAEAYMGRLNRKLTQTSQKLRVASFAFPIPGRRAVKQSDGIYLYDITPLAKKKQYR